MCRLVVLFDIHRCEALDHVISETRIAHFVEQEIEIYVDVVLHVGTCMVEVTETVEVVTGIVGSCRRIAVFRTFVIFAYIGKRPCQAVRLSCVLAGHSLIGEVTPVIKSVLVVHHHILYYPRTFRLECSYHVAQFAFGAEARVMFQPIARVIAHGLCCCIVGVRRCCSRVGNPDNVEILGQFVSLVCQSVPVRFIIGVPIESL